jgi:GAF domain-containing protein/HAMP domain-containing protein
MSLKFPFILSQTNNNLMSNKKLSSPNPNKGPFQAAIIFALVHIVLTISILIASYQSDGLDLGKAAIVTAILAITSGISAILIRSNRVMLGGWIMIGSVATLIPLTPALTAYNGWVSLTSLIAIPIVIAWIARQTLPNKLFYWAVGLGVASGVLALLLDVLQLYERVTANTLRIGFFTILAIIGIAVALYTILQFTKFRMRTKLMILFLLVALIPLGILTFLNYQSSKLIQIDVASHNLSSTAEQTASTIDTFINDTRITLRQEAMIFIFRDFIAEYEAGDEDVLTQLSLLRNVQSQLSILQNKDPINIISYAVLDRHGNILAIYPIPSDQGIPDAEAETNPQAGNLRLPDEVLDGLKIALVADSSYVSPIVFDDENAPSIYFSGNIKDPTGDRSGQLVAKYDASILQHLIETNNDTAGPDSFGVLFDENQMHIAHGTAPETLYKTVDQLSPEVATRLQERRRLPSWPLEDLSTNLPELSERLLANDPVFTATDVATGDRINQVAQQTIATKPWKVAFFQPQDVFLMPVNEQARNAIIFLVVTTVLLVGISFAATNLISAPINTLTELVEHISAGDLSIQVPVISQDEIGRLAIAFNKMTGQIRGLLSGLESQVAERTQELERRALQLQTAAEVARDASSIQDLDELLDRTVTLIQERFNFYHAGIFLLDERGEYAVLQAANSEGGKLMLEQGHRLKVGQTGLVGFVTSMGKSRIALDVGTDATHFAHPLLPETRSEIALPLIVGKNIIGALDVQSGKANAFDEEDITVLQVLADQLAIAIENTRLLSEVRQTVFELQTAYGEFTQETWKKWSEQSKGFTGYRFRGADVEPTTQQSSESILALRQGKAITKIAQKQSDEYSALAVPIRLRDQTLGVINLQFDADEISPELITLVENISNRLATTLENARLYEETQRRAAQEQLAGEITARIRESLDINAVLRTAVQEIGEKLSLNDVTIQLEMNGSSAPKEENA